MEKFSQIELWPHKTCGYQVFVQDPTFKFSYTNCVKTVFKYVQKTSKYPTNISVWSRSLLGDYGSRYPTPLLLRRSLQNFDWFLQPCTETSTSRHIIFRSASAPLRHQLQDLVDSEARCFEDTQKRFVRRYIL